MSDIFQSDRILVSIPPDAFVAGNPKSSVFKIDDNLKELLDEDTQKALSTIMNGAQELGVSLDGIMRPEMFVDEVTLNHLRSFTGPLKDHICLSTGRTIKLIDGANNHVYLYGLADAYNLDRFKDLCRRAPELVGQVTCQINTALDIRTQRFNFSPPTIYMQPESRFKYSYNFVGYNWWMMRDGRTGAEPIENPREIIVDREKNAKNIQYIVMGSSALTSYEFLRHICTALYLAVYHDDLVCLELPKHVIRSPGAWVESTYKILSQIGFRMPKLRTNNIILVARESLEQIALSKNTKIALSMNATEMVCDYKIEGNGAIDSVKLFADDSIISKEVFRDLASATFDAPTEFIWTSKI